MSSTKKHQLTVEEANDIFLKHYDFVRSIAYMNTPARHLQDDIVHDVYIVFMDKVSKWDYQPEKFEALLRSITEKVAFQHWRKWLANLPVKLRKAMEYIGRLHETETQTISMDEERLSALRSCMKKLSQDNQNLVEEYYFQGKSYDEIAQTINEESGTLRTRLCRIRGALSACIEKMMKVEVDDV